jgi:large conductance mechanosensitive channel
MIKGFKNFLMRGDIIVVAIGFIVASAFTKVITAFTGDVITPILNRFQGKHPLALGVQLGDKGSTSTFINLGDLISAAIAVVVFMAVIYFFIVTPYKTISARRGVTVFGEPAPAKTCPACLSDDLAIAATKCKYCGTDQPAA